MERNKLRYTVVISDGNAKLISGLNNEHCDPGNHIYGDFVYIMVISNLFTFMVITYLFLLF